MKGEKRQREKNINCLSTLKLKRNSIRDKKALKRNTNIYCLFFLRIPTIARENKIKIAGYALKAIRLPARIVIIKMDNLFLRFGKSWSMAITIRSDMANGGFKLNDID